MFGMSSDITEDPLAVYCSTCKTRGHQWNCYFALLHRKSVSGLINRIGGVLYYSYSPTSCTSSRMYKNYMLYIDMFPTPSQFGIFFSFTYYLYTVSYMEYTAHFSVTYILQIQNINKEY